MKELLEEINRLLNREDLAGEAEEECDEIQPEPEITVNRQDFLCLECLDKDIGRAMAVRNYWMHRCSS